MSSPSLKTSLSQVRGLGSARAGTGHFWHQRLTALANVVLAIAFVVTVIRFSGKSYEEAVAFVRLPWVALLLLLFTISGTIHMRLGMQTIIEDYVHHEGMKIAALITNTFFAIGVAAVCIFAVLKISFGA